jgi:hypothetical protein
MSPYGRKVIKEAEALEQLRKGEPGFEFFKAHSLIGENPNEFEFRGIFLCAAPCP